MNQLEECPAAEMPGYRESPRRKYVYVQSNHPEGFEDEFRRIGAEYSGVLPVSGGMMNEVAVICHRQWALCFCGVSYRGDTAAWFHVVEAYCAAHNLLYGTVGERGVTLSDGRFAPWEEWRTLRD